MEMVKFLLEMVTKLSLEVQVLKGNNTALKLQLRDLHQIYASPTYISTEVASYTHDGSARTYSDVLSSGGVTLLPQQRPFQVHMILLPEHLGMFHHLVVVTLLPLRYHPDATGMPHYQNYLKVPLWLVAIRQLMTSQPS
jgi:hypothetical protein